jgi:hypothetical protein
LSLPEAAVAGTKWAVAAVQAASYLVLDIQL